mmetsp:Transcript_19649/g.56330  ORF Transcript_19649/g.56330 Transcript_19649/m.56330 type:complete len:160 (-) Transcript_19649:511-990(-)
MCTFHSISTKAMNVSPGRWPDSATVRLRTAPVYVSHSSRGVGPQRGWAGAWLMSAWQRRKATGLAGKCSTLTTHHRLGLGLLLKTVHNDIHETAMVGVQRADGGVGAIVSCSEGVVGVQGPRAIDRQHAAAQLVPQLAAHQDALQRQLASAALHKDTEE